MARNKKIKLEVCRICNRTMNGDELIKDDDGKSVAENRCLSYELKKAGIANIPKELSSLAKVDDFLEKEARKGIRLLSINEEKASIVKKLGELLLLYSKLHKISFNYSKYIGGKQPK